jgi:hypothetical protein
MSSSERPGVIRITDKLGGELWPEMKGNDGFPLIEPAPARLLQQGFLTSPYGAPSFTTRLRVTSSNGGAS